MIGGPTDVYARRGLACGRLDLVREHNLKEVTLRVSRNICPSWHGSGTSTAFVPELSVATFE